MSQITAIEKARKIILENRGIIRTVQALQAGIHPRTLYRLRDNGELEQISRGVFRLSSLQPISDIDLVTVMSRIPKAVICLISALYYHQITTEIPRQVYIALEKGTGTPRLNYPPISVHRFSSGSFNCGMNEHTIDGVNIRIYSPEKTLVDCFKFRNKIGMDVFLEALKLYKTRMKFKLGKIMEYAEVCRIATSISPYLEIIV